MTKPVSKLVLRRFAVVFAAICVAAMTMTAHAQIPIPPNGGDGFQMGNPSARIHLEAFFDLLCPDCKAAWPTIKQVVKHYSTTSDILFTMHTFPLPYHHNAFFAAQGAHYIDQVSSKNVWKYVDLMFDKQDQFGNTQTENETRSTVIKDMATLINTEFPALKVDDIIQGLGAESPLNEDTRVSWKYSCSRYVSGTPTFLVNGVNVAADPSWSVTDWQTVLDPLVKTKKQMPVRTVSKLGAQTFINKLKSDKQCPSGEPKCEYLPGKIECCKAGENCIPNVGCRC